MELRLKLAPAPGAGAFLEQGLGCRCGCDRTCSCGRDWVISWAGAKVEGRVGAGSWAGIGPRVGTVAEMGNEDEGGVEADAETGAGAGT